MYVRDRIGVELKGIGANKPENCGKKSLYGACIWTLTTARMRARLGVENVSKLPFNVWG